MNMEDYISRLVQCGFSQENAKAICKAYKDRKDLKGLTQFVHNAEELYRGD